MTLIHNYFCRAALLHQFQEHNASSAFQRLQKCSNSSRSSRFEDRTMQSSARKQEEQKRWNRRSRMSWAQHSPKLCSLLRPPAKGVRARTCRADYIRPSLCQLQLIKLKE